MGIETAMTAVVAVESAVAVAGAIGKGNYQIKAAGQRLSALNLQAKQIELQTQQRTLENYDVMEKMLDAQIAHQTTTGTALGSPSFNAIQRDTINKFAKKQANIETEESLYEQNIKTERSNVKSRLYSELFGDIVDTGMTITNAWSKLPKKGK